MPKRTPEQKLARQIQAATGKKYMVCLAEAKATIADMRKGHPLARGGPSCERPPPDPRRPFL